MKKLALLCTLLAAAVVAAGSVINLDPASTIDFTDCASGGSSASTIALGDWLMTVTGSDTHVCFLNNSTTTCASGGRIFPVGTVMVITIEASVTHIRCRSSASTGDVQFTRVNVENR